GGRATLLRVGVADLAVPEAAEAGNHGVGAVRDEDHAAHLSHTGRRPDRANPERDLQAAADQLDRADEATRRSTFGIRCCVAHTAPFALVTSRLAKPQATSRTGAAPLPPRGLSRTHPGSSQSLAAHARARRPCC